MQCRKSKIVADILGKIPKISLMEGVVGAIKMPVPTNLRVLGGIIAGSQLSRLYPAASLLPPVGNFAFIESSLTNSFI